MSTPNDLKSILTDDMLSKMADAAWAAGDVVMAMRCDHAIEDPFARQDVAMILRERGSPLWEPQ